MGFYTVKAASQWYMKFCRTTVGIFFSLTVIIISVSAPFCFNVLYGINRGCLILYL